VTATSRPVPREDAADLALAEKLKAGREAIVSELRKLIVGQDDAIELALISLFTGGNSLIIGVPGLAKTLLVHTLAQVLDLKFSRIQFTPDLMPSDITGTDIIQEEPETGRRRLAFVPGPIFANIVLADEINRTPPKTQAALLEAMQEHRVTVQGKTYELEEPFFVLATQNPIELEGTYPLPEAQLDRFMFEIVIDYLNEEQEVEVVQATTSVQNYQFQHAVTGPDIVAFQQLVRRVPVADAVARYAVALARASRPTSPTALEVVRKWLAYGASVRAPQHLILGGKARALMRGRYHVGFEDIRALAKPVFRHRILRNFHAESERITTDYIVDRLLEAVPVPKSGL
jgi:MoxR-like ATPase